MDHFRRTSILRRSGGFKPCLSFPPVCEWMTNFRQPACTTGSVAVLRERHNVSVFAEVADGALVVIVVARHFFQS